MDMIDSFFSIVSIFNQRVYVCVGVFVKKYFLTIIVILCSSLLTLLLLKHVLMLSKMREKILFFFQFRLPSDTL